MNTLAGGQPGGRCACVMRLAACLALLAGLAVTDAAHAAVQVGSVRASVLSDHTGSEPTRHGYREYRVALRNTADEPARVTIALGDEGLRGTALIERLQRQVTVAAETRTVVALHQPPLPMARLLLVTVAGQTDGLQLPAPEHEPRPRWHGGSNRIGSILRSQGIDPRTESRATGDNPPRPVEFYRANLPVEQWSDAAWLTFSVFDLVMLTGDEFDRLRPAVRENLRRYLLAGGALAVVGESDWPRNWRAAWHRRAPAEQWDNDRIERFDLGFGAVIRLPAAEPGLPAGDLGPLIDIAGDSAAPFSNPSSVDQANRALPVIEDLGIPRRGMLVLMVAFALTIGPINLLVLHRLKKQIWLLGTVPAIAVIFCLAVWGYATASEGFAGRERTAALTFLDQPNQVAASIGWAGFYAPLTPGGGLRFEPHTELTPQIDQDRGGNDQRGRTVQWGEGQRLSNGWIVARVPAHFRLRKADDALLRLAVQRDPGGTLAVTNGLKADIQSLHLMGHDGAVYQLSNLEAGARAEPGRMNPVPEAGSASRSLRSVFNDDWLDGLDDLRRSPAAYLRPGRYIAVLAEEPFVESGLDLADRRETETVVYGVFAPPRGDAGQPAPAERENTRGDTDQREGAGGDE